MKNILFITHDTSRSGAPKSLLLFLNQLYLEGWEFSTISLKGGGELEEEFRKISKNFFVYEKFKNKPDYTLKSRILRKIINKKILSEEENFIHSLSKHNFKLIYGNTIGTIYLAKKINNFINSEIIIHIHELKTVIDELCKNESYIKTGIKKYIVPSFLNMKCLENEYGINKDKIFLIRECSKINYNNKKHVKSTNKFRVLMCGGAYWRKGDDIFIQIANLVLKAIKNIEFIWVGHISDERKRVNKADILKLEIENNVFFIPETQTPEIWYSSSDLFLLCSREDPFPLAAIEAGMSELPILCFDKATGISEVIEKEFVIPYLDINEMANKIIELINDPIKRIQTGEKNKKNFTQFTPDKIKDKIVEIL